jgi:hypothetical protein
MQYKKLTLFKNVQLFVNKRFNFEIHVKYFIFIDVDNYV